jgi:seryl-tRNA synthetase
MRVEVVLEHPIPAALVTEVHDRLAYASELIRDTEIAGDGSRVALELDHPDHAAEAAAAVRRMVSALIRGYRAIDSDVVWRNAVAPANAAPIWDAMVGAGLVHLESPGCVALLGDACRVLAAVDAWCQRQAHDVFGAVPHQYPTLLPVAAMERCDYFASFPHHITFAPHLQEALDGIDRVAQAPPAERAARVSEALAPASHLLSPSVCFHTYLRFADATVAPPIAVTAVNRCYRWESSNFATCERLWDFTMREIVFLGAPDWVAACRQRAMGVFQELVVALGLDGWIETAHDPFFVGRFAAKRYFQLLTRAKYELRLALPYSGGSLSVASFNVHDDFFGRSFAIRGPDTGFVATACAGAGLERWVWALFAQHGVDLARWPATARGVLGL